MKTLPPVMTRADDWDTIEAEILSAIRTTIYAPLVKLLGKTILKNSKDDLVSGIASGALRYDDGAFVGVFSASVSRTLKEFGAVWSRKRLGWSIRRQDMPEEVQVAVDQAAERDGTLQRAVLDALDQLDPKETAAKTQPEAALRRAVGRTDQDFRRSVRSVTVMPKLSQGVRIQVAAEYSTNLRKYVQDFAAEEILRLREEVSAHVFKGERTEELAKRVALSYGVSKRKARFLARQETNLMTTKLKEARYAEAGIDEYYWQSVIGTAEHPVRPIHKALNDRSKRGEIFRFSKPPVTAPNGARNSPGEDFGCRCIARPVVRFKD